MFEMGTAIMSSDGVSVSTLPLQSIFFFFESAISAIEIAGAKKPSSEFVFGKTEKSSLSSERERGWIAPRRSVLVPTTYEHSTHTHWVSEGIFCDRRRNCFSSSSSSGRPSEALARDRSDRFQTRSRFVFISPLPRDGARGPNWARFADSRPLWTREIAARSALDARSLNVRLCLGDRDSESGGKRLATSPHATNLRLKGRTQYEREIEWERNHLTRFRYDDDFFWPHSLFFIS